MSLPDDMQKSTLSVAFCGLSGFPHATSPAVQRMTAMAKALRAEHMRVRIINRKGIMAPDADIPDKPHGTYAHVPYLTASGMMTRPTGFLRRNARKLRAVIAEGIILLKLRRKQRLDVVVLDTSYLWLIVWHKLLQLLLGHRLVYQYVELRSQVGRSKKSLLQRWTHYWIDHRAIHWFDGIMPISRHLQAWLYDRRYRGHVHRVPVVTDYTHFTRQRQPSTVPKFVYCGGLAYYEVITFLIEAFEALPAEEPAQLHLIVNGAQDAYQQLEARIAKSARRADIVVHSGLSQESLAQAYADATALLIPLRPTAQDEARFPFKISEYLASGNPVITTAYGEFPYFVQDGESALITSEYDVTTYAQKMAFVLANHEDAQAIGEAGRLVGLAHFHYPSIQVGLARFLWKVSTMTPPTKYSQTYLG